MLLRTYVMCSHIVVSLTRACAQDVPNVKMTMCPPTWKHLQHGSDHTYDHNVYKNDGERYQQLGLCNARTE